MSTPGFTAEASLHKTSQVYRGYSGASALNASLPAVRGQIVNPRCLVDCLHTYFDCYDRCVQADQTCIGLDCKCLDDCWTSLGNCEANCTRRLLTLPPSVVRPLGP
jgi:hypothetical protein